MTEYELASLFLQTVDVANASMANFLAVTFGMMVVCYMAAHKLDRASAIVVLALYTLYSLGLINELYSEYRDLIGIGSEIAKSAAEPGSRLGWHGFVVAGPDSYLKYVPYWVLAMCGLGFLATIWFFFHMRRRHAVTS